MYNLNNKINYYLDCFPALLGCKVGVSIITNNIIFIDYVYKVCCLGIKSDNSNFAWFGFNIIIDNSNYMTIVINGYNR